MLERLKRLFAAPGRRPTVVHPAVGAPLAGHAGLPDDLVAEDAFVAPFQVDGDPARGRPAAKAFAPALPRDVFVVPGGLGLPALALVNVRDPHARIDLWALDSPTPGAGTTFDARRTLRMPAGQPATGWQVTQVAPLPRLQCLVVLRQDAEPRTALVAVLGLATGAVRVLDVAEPGPFDHAILHAAALRAAQDAVLVRWHRGRVKLGHWGDVAVEDRIVLFTSSERDGLEVLTLALDDGNVHAWAMQGTTLWMQAIDGRLSPSPRRHIWSLDLSRLL